jgi:hypothetical protein
MTVIVAKTKVMVFNGIAGRQRIAQVLLAAAATSSLLFTTFATAATKRLQLRAYLESVQRVQMRPMAVAPASH